MFIEERHKIIADSLASRMRLTMEDVQALVKASPATVRRDLKIMEEQGRIVRVHGGAVHPDFMEGEPTFAQKSHDAVTAKLAIAEKVSEIIQPGASVFVDSGTTCLEVGKR
ncbi:MAG: DeoR family transcriptional regulator, partial [Opitutaceae bacterium]